MATEVNDPSNRARLPGGVPFADVVREHWDAVYRMLYCLTGIPPADKVRAFLNSNEPKKRAKLIDELLATPDYGRHMADIWQDLLLPPRDSTSKGLQYEPMVTWLTDQFNVNKPWDAMVTELITATGTRTAFVDFFHPSEGADQSEYSAGIPQVLRLMNSSWMKNSDTAVSEIVRSGRTPAQNIDRLYLATLARRPTAAETQRLVKYLQSSHSDAQKAYSDMLWALLNSSEFTLNH